MAERELRCKRCSRFVPISEMKYEKTGSFLICAQCQGKKDEPKARIIPPSGGPFGQPKIYKYQCTNCRYMFRRSAGIAEVCCPNCAGKKLIRFEKLSADDVLKIADDKRFEKF